MATFRDLLSAAKAEIREVDTATASDLIAGGSLEMLKNRLAEIIFERRFSQRPPRAASEKKPA